MKNKHRNTFLLLGTSPIIILLLICTLVLARERAVITDQYHLNQSDTKSIFFLFDKELLLDSYTQDDYKDLSSLIATNPEKLRSGKTLNAINSQLKKKYSFLVLQKGDKYVYFGDITLQSSIQSRLAQCGESYTSKDAFFFYGDQGSYLCKKISFPSEDDETCSAYIVTNLNVTLPHVQRLTYGFFALVLVVIVFITIAIVGYAYYHIISPIHRLQIAVNYITSGDLDYSIDPSSDDEFTKLYEDFEVMRLQLRDSKEEQEKSDRLTRELIGNISHDLKTPLTAIKGYAEAIMDGVATSPERMEKYMETIYAKARDMAVLVDELAFFTSINQNNVPYNFSKVKANLYISSCVSEFTTDLELKGISILFQTELADTVMIRIDIEKMKRVLNNIIGNASKYIDAPRGYIFVRLIDAEDHVILRVEDSGKGIEADELPHIFDRFYRTDSSRNSTTGGSGLGLAITKKIVEDHGGRISAESTIGKGTAIICTIGKYKDMD